jgi:sortase A
MVAAWTLAVVVGVGLVVYGLGPLFQTRDQRKLIRAEKLAVDQASSATSSLSGTTAPAKAPDPLAPLGILEVGRIRLQQVVVEGVASSHTRKGPGHVQGTAGLGQPGNSVVVGRAHGFAGPFRRLGSMRKGDKILVTTTQGQSVYEVTEVKKVDLGSDASVDALYGPSKDDRLTLVTSRSVVPWNKAKATVVVATMAGKAFPPTAQNGRTNAQSGMDGDQGASAAVLVAMVVFGATLGASVLLYQRFQFATAYILAIGPILAAAIIAGETLSRLFPAWM